LRRVKPENYFKQLGRLEKEEEDEEIKVYKGLLNRRKSILHESSARLDTLLIIVRAVEMTLTSPHVLIFHERIALAEKIYQSLKSMVPADIYHSKLPPDARELALQRFADGDSRYLVSCKALDEGLDVPDASVGILVASTNGIRQRIQRIGRVLRKAENKNYSLIFTIYVPEYESDIFGTEEYQAIEGASEVRILDLRQGKLTMA
jgi:superfamily II DNA or RNA helicase